MNRQDRKQRAWMLFLSLLLFNAPQLLAADADFLNVFPPSPAIANLIYSGQLSYTTTYTPSGSSWAPGLNEQEVFFASLKHVESADNGWEIRIGRGGQLYSLRGPFGEGAAPQTQPDAHWIDQVFQLVGVDRALNLNTPGHAYFIHQAGDYLDDPILTSTFYSPMLASAFDARANSASVLNWGQQARIPNINQAGLLYYERLKDLGGGVIELTYVVYNFGADLIDYLNTPWGGVRKSALPVTMVSNPDGSSRVVSGLFGNTTPINLINTGGWIAWTQDAKNPSSPTLALVTGKDLTPRPSYQSAPARLQYGTAGTVDDFEVVEIDPFVNQGTGSAFFFRVYLVAGSLNKVQILANSLVGSAARGPLSFDEDSADLLPVYSKSVGTQTVMTTSGTPGQEPTMYTYAQPVANSLPLFVLRNTTTGQLRLSTDPCELCTKVALGNDVMSKPYDGTVQYVGFLGYVLPAPFIKTKTPVYENMLDVVGDRSYFPATSTNQTLKVVSQRMNITSVNVAGGGSDIAQNTWIEIKGTGLASSDVGANGMTWSAAPEFAFGKMPTTLAGVGVTVNGKPASVYFIAPNQVNVLTPLDGTQGTVQVQLTNGPNTTNPFNVNMKAVAPAFLLLGSTHYIAATHADGSLLGPSSLSLPGYTLSPARPNETIVLYANGCGLPILPVVQGSASQSGVLPILPAIQIGGRPAAVTFAGIVSPGLCQFNVVVPMSAADGDTAVTAVLSGVNATPGALIAVAR